MTQWKSFPLPGCLGCGWLILFHSVGEIPILLLDVADLRSSETAADMVPRDGIQEDGQRVATDPGHDN